MEKKYHGIIVPAPTPVLEDETVDEKAYRTLIRYLIKNGVDGVFAAGTLGESMALTQAERDRAIRIAADEAKGEIKIFGGVMDTSTKRVIENIKRIEDSGCDAAVITPVFYDRHTSQGEVVRLFEDVAKTTDMDLVVYNIPTFVVAKILAPTVVELANIPSVKAYKESTADFNETSKVLDMLGDREDFSILQGTPVQYMGSAALGIDGCVPSMASLYPRLFAAAYEATKKNDVELLRKFNHMILQAGKIYGAAKNGTAAVKYATSLLGFMSDRIIRPQDGVSEEEAAKIRDLKVICDQMCKDAGVESVL